MDEGGGDVRKSLGKTVLLRHSATSTSCIIG